MRYLLVILLLCLPSQAQAWTCFTLKIGQQKYLYVHDYEIIFKGKVMSIRDMSAEELHRHYPDKDASWKYAPQIATFEIEKKYKSILGDTIEVQDFSGSGPHSTHYKVGESYYVFANEKNGLATPVGCVGSMYGMEDYNRGQITLEKLRAEARMYVEMIAENPDVPFLYQKQAEFYQDFDDHERALMAYKKGWRVLNEKMDYLHGIKKMSGAEKLWQRAYVNFLVSYGVYAHKTGKEEVGKNIRERLRNIPSEVGFTSAIMQYNREIKNAENKELEKQNP